MQKHIAALKQEASEKLQFAEKLEKLLTLYPDLSIDKDRWNNIIYCAKSANDKVIDYELKHGCGCCPDATAIVYPYIDTEHGRVYSNPHFYVGSKDECSDGYKENNGWKEKLRTANIPEEIIQKVSLLFGKKDNQ